MSPGRDGSLQFCENALQSPTGVYSCWILRTLLFREAVVTSPAPLKHRGNWD